MIDLRITYMSSRSWKQRKKNGGYWQETWERCNKKGCKWQHKLRWRSI